MSASQQVSADSGALSHIVFGRNEPALHHYHNTYRAALGLDLLPLLDERDAVGSPVQAAGSRSSGAARAASAGGQVVASRARSRAR